MTGKNYRKLVLWGALVVTVLAALQVNDEAEQHANDIAQAVLPSASSSNDRRSAGQLRETLPVDQLGKRKFNAEADDIFAVTSWEPKRAASRAAPLTFLQQQQQQTAQRAAVQQQAVLQRPPVAAAPPLQFEYLGRVSSNGKTRVFLAWGDKNHITGVGERIDGQYRIDQIREDAVELTYLPLGIRQTLLINAGNSERL